MALIFFLKMKTNQHMLVVEMLGGSIKKKTTGTRVINM